MREIFKMCSKTQAWFHISAPGFLAIFEQGISLLALVCLVCLLKLCCLIAISNFLRSSLIAV